MKLLIAFLAVTLSSGLCHAECMGQAEAANSFINEYKKYCDDSLHKKTKATTDQWVQRNAKVTEHFKNSYKKLVEDANKEDPEMGLDFDPIFDAQDYPDQGFKILSCDEKSNLVTLNGKDWKDFTVVVKTSRTDKGWLIDGAGVINIPKNKRAHRE